jgi:hypothetical protein
VSDDFVRDLEEELVAAARYRAGRRRHRVRLPRPARRSVVGALLGAATVAAIVALGALALSRGDDDRAAVERRATPPPGGLVVPLVPMIEATSCRGLEVRNEPAAGQFSEIGLFARAQRPPDSIPPPRGNVITWVPVRTFDPSESRVAGYKRLPTTVHAFPSLGVSTDGSCRRDDGPGVCLAELERDFRCFTRSQVQGGGAVALNPEGWAIGIVPDGIGRVTLSARGRTATADVVENVYEARLGVPAGAEVRVAPAPPGAGCRHAVAPKLLERVAVLRRPANDGPLLPRPALAVVREWQWQLDAIVEDGARFWGGGDGVEFWAVPVVPRAAEGCAPATGVCIVAVTEDQRADAHCVWGERELRKGTWKLGPLFADRAVLYGIEPSDVTGARVTIGNRHAEVDGSENVIGGVVPFPYSNSADVRVDLIRRPPSPKPAVGIVDAGGDADVVKSVLDAGGYETLPRITPGVKGQEIVQVYWRPELTRKLAAIDVAELVAADELVRIGDTERVPRPVLETQAPVVVVVGSG